MKKEPRPLITLLLSAIIAFMMIEFIMGALISSNNLKDAFIDAGKFFKDVAHEVKQYNPESSETDP